MIVWTSMGAALAILVWLVSRNPADAVSFGLLAVLAGTVVLSAVSNRVQRRLRAFAARMLCRLGYDRRAARTRLLAPLERLRTLPELFERLPDVTAAAANVEPVTLFVLDDDRTHYVPVCSTLLTVPCMPVASDDPLASALRASGRVHDLTGRTDDLENAPIHAVNGQQVEECQAVCALPLRRDGTLAGFLLCGGSDGRARLGLMSSGCLEELGRRYDDMIARCPGADITLAGRLAVTPVATARSVSA